MEGDPAIPVITDSWLKGLRDFDIETAYEAFLKSATTPGAQNPLRPDIDPYIERGYVPLGFYAKDLAGDASVSHALEYYVADHALSLLAAALGHDDDARLFRERSLGYRHYYDREPTRDPQPICQKVPPVPYTMASYLAEVAELFRGHEVLRDYAASLGARIVNCTRSSMIDAYERRGE